MIGNSPISPKEGNQLKIPNVLPLPSWGPEYEISLDIKINSFLKEKYGSIFRFASIDAKKSEKIGSRSPGLWTKKSSNELYTVSDINSTNKG